MALLGNPNLAVSASNFRIAHYNVVAGQGRLRRRAALAAAVELLGESAAELFRGGPGRGRRLHARRRSLRPARATSFSISRHSATALNGQTENGTTYQAGIEQSRTYNNTLFNAYNPYYLATLNLAVTQPLLKNFGMNPTKRQLKLAFINADAGDRADAGRRVDYDLASREHLLGSRRRLAQRRDPGGRAEGGRSRSSRATCGSRGAAPRRRSTRSSRRRKCPNFQDGRLRGAADASRSFRTGSRASSRQTRTIRSGTPISCRRRRCSRFRRRAIWPASSRRRKRIVPKCGRRRTSGCAADIDVVFAKNQSLPQADVQAQYQSNGFAGILTPVPAFILGYCTGSGRTAGSGCQAARRRRPTRKARCRGRITTCGRAISRPSISR